jgi:protein SCO1/2
MAFFIMKKIQKVIIMISVLLAPIFVFLFLKEYGANQFELPVLYPEGNPIAECRKGVQQHTLTSESLSESNVELPALFYVPSTQQNKFYSDLNSVLGKHNRVSHYELILEDTTGLTVNSTSLSFTAEAYINFLNCELILGEDHLLKEPIVNKYVLVDDERRIRGYYNCTDLEDIERLDVELDILINY